MEYDPLDEGRAKKPKKIAQKYKREIETLAKKGQSPEMGKHKVYMALYNLAWENGDIRGDDPDEADEVIDDYMDDIMGEFFAHIKEGFKSDAQRRAAFASGYKAKGKKDKKEEVELDENKGLKNKAEKSGMPLGILKQVYNRGLAAYKTGHRPGTTAPQWAMARVNSFITKGEGTWGKADKDLADKVRGKAESVKELEKSIDEWIAADGSRRRVHEKDKRKKKNVMDSYRTMWEDAVEIVEKKELDPKIIQKIAKLTDRNDHNESLYLLATAMRDKEAVKLLDNIKGMHKVYGHMPKELIDLRNRIFDNLMRQSSSKYSNHKDVYGAL